MATSPTTFNEPSILVCFPTYKLLSIEASSTTYNLLLNKASLVTNKRSLMATSPTTFNEPSTFVCFATYRLAFVEISLSTYNLLLNEASFVTNSLFLTDISSLITKLLADKSSFSSLTAK